MPTQDSFTVPRSGGRSSFKRKLATVLPVVFCVLGGSIGDARAVTYFVTPSGGAGFDEQGRQVASVTRRYDDATFALLQPGDTLQLLADAPSGTTRFAGRVSLRGKGNETSAPIVVRGLGDRTRIVGKAIDALRDCPMPTADVEKSCDERALVIAGLPATSPTGKVDLLEALTDTSRGLPSGPEAIPFAVPAFGSGGRLTEATCIDVDRVDGLTLEDLAFEDCWLSAVRALGSRRLTLRRALIRGGSYGVAVKGRAGRPADEIRVEHVTWVQDTSGYAAIAREGSQACAAPDGTARPTPFGCPGQIWRGVPWGVTHHGVAEHYNGALLGGVDVSGKVVFRHNRVLSAYNGIRLKAKACEGIPASKLTPETCRYNTDVWVTDNLFSYVRDNPVEMEVWSRNVRIARNQVHNAHAWFSFDNMGGGPIYVYANRGWFDDMPALRWSNDVLGGPACSRDPRPKPQAGGAFDPTLDRRFDYATATWLPVALMEREARGGRPVDVWMREDEQLCETSLAGRVLKFALPETGTSPDTFRYPAEPIYVFHNSWYLRAPVTATGAAVHLRHWNNAILFCETGVAGHHPELCAPRPAELTRANCGQGLVKGEELARIPAERGTVPFFDCFRWLPVDETGRDRRDLESEFDFDVSSIGFPPLLKIYSTFEPHGRSGDPGFTAAAAGDFRLRPGALAAQSGCQVVRDGERLACRSLADPAQSFAGAVSPAGELYGGPGGPNFDQPL
ncbi:MAG TPA: hypothetical protein VGU24_07205 [Microvirga sp.]|nr:hypothetical protein [Microvirga sp.]